MIPSTNQLEERGGCGDIVIILRLILNISQSVPKHLTQNIKTQTFLILEIREGTYRIRHMFDGEVWKQQLCRGKYIFMCLKLSNFLYVGYWNILANFH